MRDGGQVNGVRARERGAERAKTLDINRHGALILATVYMLLHLSRVRDPSSSRASSRGHALHIREMCYVVREDIYYGRGTCVPSMKTYNEISPACRKFPRSTGYLQIVRPTTVRPAATLRDRGLSSTLASNLGFSSAPSDVAAIKYVTATAAHRRRILNGPNRSLFAEIGLNYSLDCASACSPCSLEVSNFLLLAHTEICLAVV